MVTAHATSDDGTRIIFLGLTRANIKLLLAGKPIRVRAETHPGFPADVSIMVAFGENERAIVDMMRPLIDRETTKIIATPRDPSGQVS